MDTIDQKSTLIKNVLNRLLIMEKLNKIKKLQHCPCPIHQSTTKFVLPVLMLWPISVCTLYCVTVYHFKNLKYIYSDILSLFPLYQCICTSVILPSLHYAVNMAPFQTDDSGGGGGEQWEWT